MSPLVPWAWGGGVSTLFAYGQTGSGKTFTVDALARKAAEHLFGGGLEGQRDVYLSCFELAGNVASGMLLALLLFSMLRVFLLAFLWGDKKRKGSSRLV